MSEERLTRAERRVRTSPNNRSISPSVTSTLHVAHRPWQQACGR